jgi:hypothetical protein
MQIMTLKKSLFTYHPKTQNPFFTYKHGNNLLNFLLMFGVDPPLHFVFFLALLLPKTILQSRQNTTHACYFSTCGLDIKHKSNKTYISHALGWEKYSFINLKMNQLTIMIEIGHRSSILILGSSSSLSSNCFS